MKSVIWKLVFVISFCSLSINAFADWQCSVIDKGGHRWAFKGMTQDHANQVALSFCTAYSPNSGSCHTSNCSMVQ